MAKNTKNAQKSQNRQNKVSHGKQKRKVETSNKSTNKDSFLSTNTKKDLIGVTFIVIAVALFAVSIIPTDAPVSAFCVGFLRLIFGVGVYFLPVFLIAIGITFFFHMEKQVITARMGLGCCLIFPAILTIVTTCSPCATAKHYELFFNSDVLSNYGGVIGSVFAWIGCTLLGTLVAIILMSGVILAGLIVIGLSISNIVKRLNQRREDIDNQRSASIKRAPVNENISMVNPQQQNLQGQTAAINNNNPIDKFFHKNKKPTNTGRIQPENYDPTQDISFAPNQKNTQVLGDELDKKSIPEILPEKTAENQASETKSLKSDKKTPSTKSAKTQLLEDIPDTKSSKPKNVKVSSGGSAYPTPTPDFVLPSMSLLRRVDGSSKSKNSHDSLKTVANNLQTTLANFGITAKVVGWVEGPTVTLFKIDLPAGIRVSRITALNDDIALALAAPGVRIFAPIPGTTYVGIEVPNAVRQNVLLGEILETAKPGPMQIAIGKDVEGNCIVSDLSKMPHLLIGGTTGSGKSVSINAMIMSIITRATPSEVKLILVDPKRVEFTPYNDIPHLYVPVVTEAKEAASALNWGCAEMERRLKVFSSYGVRNINSYNAKVQKGQTDQDGNPLEELPYIVIIIDELADLMMAAGKEVEYSIARLAQLARAAGIHLIVATQRPSTNIVTGLIKANITNRIAFNVASGIDSRVILDVGGAESLIGLGDLLLSKPELSKPLRVQGCYVSEEEIEKVVAHIKEQGKPDYHEDILKTQFSDNKVDSAGSAGPYSGSTGDDSLVWDAADMIVQNGHGSTSSLQRRFKIGYSRAGRIMDMLEEKGIVGPQNGSKPREVLVDASELEGIKALEAFENEN